MRRRPHGDHDAQREHARHSDADAGHEPDVSTRRHAAHAQRRRDHGHEGHGGAAQESPWVVTLPLVLLAIPSVVIGWFTIEPLLFGGYFGDAIHVADSHDVLHHVGEEFHGPAQFVLHGLHGPGGLARRRRRRAGLVPVPADGRNSPTTLREKAGGLYTLLVNKYYFDAFNEKVLARRAAACWARRSGRAATSR